MTVSGRARMKAIPHEFLGISTEYTTLPLVEQHPDTWQQLLGQLSDPSDGRLPVRIGGDSAEHVLYNPEKPIQLAPWEKAYVPPRALLEQTARIIDESRMDVILDMNTITGHPKLMAKYWRELSQQKFPLGRGRIVGMAALLQTCHASPSSTGSSSRCTRRPPTASRLTGTGSCAAPFGGSGACGRP